MQKKKNTMQALREKRELQVLNMNFSFRFNIYKNLLLLHVQRAEIFFPNSMEIWYVPIYLRLTVCKWDLFRSERFGECFPDGRN